MTVDPIPAIEIIWTFLRGDTQTAAFEQWVYAEPGLEDLLGAEFYLEVISVDYGDSRRVVEIKQALEAFCRSQFELSCECIALPDLADIKMGDLDGRDQEVFKAIEQRGRRGDPIWWLSADQCSVCGQWWLVASEERHNDVYFLKRLSAEDGMRILQTGQWPDDFDRFETLLRLGRTRGHAVRFVEPLNSSLPATAADLARARPGIGVSELLNLDRALAEAVARKAVAEEGAVIDFAG